MSSGPDAPAPDRRPARGPRRSSMTGRALVLALVAATLLVSMAVPVRAWLAQRAQIAELRTQVSEASDRVAALEVERDRWQDPAFVAAQARERLHFVLPGEVGYVAIGAGDTAEEHSAQQDASVPWYATLWNGLQQADDHDSAPAGTADQVP